MLIFEIFRRNLPWNHVRSSLCERLWKMVGNGWRMDELCLFFLNVGDGWAQNFDLYIRVVRELDLKARLIELVWTLCRRYFGILQTIWPQFEFWSVLITEEAGVPTSCWRIAHVGIRRRGPRAVPGCACCSAQSGCPAVMCGINPLHKCCLSATFKTTYPATMELMPDPSGPSSPR